nr:RNA-binding protein 7-like [Leptinotarsa decemlineata]
MDDTKTVWCGNLSDQVTEELLYELFLQAGPLERVKIPTDKEGRKSNFAFITFKHEQSVNYVLQLLKGIRLFDKLLNVKPRNGNSQNRPLDRNAGQPDFQNNKINHLRLGCSPRFDHSPNRFADNRLNYSGNNSFHDMDDKHHNQEIHRDMQYDHNLHRSHHGKEDQHYDQEIKRDMQYERNMHRSHHDREDQHYEQDDNRDKHYDRDIRRNHYVQGRRNHSDTPYRRNNYSEGRNNFNSRHGRKLGRF